MIDNFRGKYYFLSNFYDVRVEYKNILYGNAEAAFQAQKCPLIAKEFAALTPREARNKGRKVKIRKDWEVIKDGIMYEVVKAKFMQNRDLAKMLVETGDEELVEGNTWNDIYWGVCRGKGKNMLGKILMMIREELRNSI